MVFWTAAGRSFNSSFLAFVAAFFCGAAVFFSCAVAAIVSAAIDKQIANTRFIVGSFVESAGPMNGQDCSCRALAVSMGLARFRQYLLKKNASIWSAIVGNKR